MTGFTATGVRWILAAIVVVVLGGTILGVGQGAPGSGPGTSARRDVGATDGGGGGRSADDADGRPADGAKGSGQDAAGGAAAAKRRLTALGPVAARGRDVFTGDGGCGGCHGLADAKTAGTIGPDLDESLSRQSLALIRQGIVDPRAVVAEGYPADLMPDRFDEQLSKHDLDALVRYLFAATHTG